jgi:virulence factor
LRIDRQRLKVAVVGAGHMANMVHYPSLASLNDVEIVALCDINAQRARETAERYRVERTYADYREMVDREVPDAIYVIGQPHIMFDIWVWCLESGLNLFIEKPMGITWHQARILADLAEKHDCITQVGFQRRSSPMFRELRHLCSGKGDINLVTCVFYKYSVKPFLNARDHILDDAVHALDTLRWLAGSEVKRLSSTTRRIQVSDINLVTAMLEFENGVVGMLANNWASGRRSFSIEIHAPGVWVVAEHEGRALVYQDGGDEATEYDARQVAGSDEFYVFAGFREKHREFIDAVKSGSLPSSHFGDALHTMELAERILACDVLNIGSHCV